MFYHSITELVSCLVGNFKRLRDSPIKRAATFHRSGRMSRNHCQTVVRMSSSSCTISGYQIEVKIVRMI